MMAILVSKNRLILSNLEKQNGDHDTTQTLQYENFEKFWKAEKTDKK